MKHSAMSSTRGSINARSAWLADSSMSTCSLASFAPSQAFSPAVRNEARSGLSGR
ncbi:hypothetical protein D3C87_1698380 [compost metagenome]